MNTSIATTDGKPGSSVPLQIATAKRAMAMQAESERERRTKNNHAEGEFQASGTIAGCGGNAGEAPDGDADAWRSFCRTPNWI
jgi:hypothetical protein